MFYTLCLTLLLLSDGSKHIHAVDPDLALSFIGMQQLQTLLSLSNNF